MAEKDAAKKKPCGCGGKPVLQAKIIVKEGSSSGPAASKRPAAGNVKKGAWYHRFLAKMKALF
ncbi:hypothetical protein GKZ89_14980 [Bacillus mangrovi]|uniref:Uncharacterized protein n=1 Tax=Metabacillus mangrovi TaxID=1491830 RepID=A0A7X2V5R5_9BACI|nr:hypothetical protein [Metabacillus mangrovi]MTH54705.1 hypothetical protein [Metabacillus mangrovi]